MTILGNEEKVTLPTSLQMYFSKGCGTCVGYGHCSESFKIKSPKVCYDYAYDADVIELPF